MNVSVVVAKGKVKSTYDLPVKTKHRLAILKADLRAAGLSASESSILEVLIDEADPKALARYFRNAEKASSR